MDNTTRSLLEQEDSLTTTGLKTASLLLFMLVGTFSNGRVLYTVLVVDVIRPPLNRFVASLSFADLASCLLLIPFALVSLASGKWIFGQVFCALHVTLGNYFAQVACLNVGAMVYERYQAIYRKRFPSLSRKNTNILLCFAWLCPIPPSAVMLSHQFDYNAYTGMCFLAPQHWNAINIATEIAIAAFVVLFVTFSFRKILSLILPLRRRVSPGLLSNEEKLTMAAHVHSAWTLLTFILVYVILVAPIFIAGIVNNKSLYPGKSLIPDKVVCVFLWLYWLQCSIKPFVYVMRSNKCTRCLFCGFCVTGLEGEKLTSCFGRQHSRVYKANGDLFENNRGSCAGLPVSPDKDDGFLDLFRTMPISSPVRSVPEHARSADDATSQSRQDRSICFGNIIQNSVFIEDLESHTSECEEERNSCREISGNNGTTTIHNNVCQEAVELDIVEGMLDEALKAQQKVWARSTSRIW